MKNFEELRRIYKTMEAEKKYYKDQIEVQDPLLADSVLHYHNTYYIQSVETGAEYYKALDPYPLDPPREYIVTNRLLPTQSVEVEPMPDPNTLEGVKYYKEQEIEEWNAGSEVNEFYLNGAPMWLTKEERADFLGSLQAMETLGIEAYNFGFGGLTVNITVQLGKQLMASIQLYASACESLKYSKINAMKALSTIEEVQAYDYKTGYPEKLNFTLS